MAQIAQPGAFSRWFGFLKRQPYEWRITATRTSIFRFFYQMVLPYLSIYTLALGASATELGLVNSLGMAVAAFLSPLTGWLIDRIGTKKIYLAGIALLALSWTIYAVAQTWTIIIAAMLAYWVGFRTCTNSCATICGNSLRSEDRATAMSCCESVAAGFLGILGPILGAFLVTGFGGVNLPGIRPLFFISLGGTVATFVLIYRQLSDCKWGNRARARPALWKDLSDVLSQGRGLKRFILISVIAYLPMGMVIPFTQPFANEVKGADQFVLGAMVTGFGLTPLAFGIPVGKLADRLGRKKALYAIAPLFWASNLLLIWAPNSAFLITAGILQGFFFVNLVTTAAMEFELVPAEHMGRWMGINGFFRMLATAFAAFISGLIWDNLGPEWVFLLVVGLDAFVRLPLLIGMSETLGMKKAGTVLP